MKILVDAQLSPAIAAWTNREFDQIEAVSVRSVYLRDVADLEIYRFAEKNGYVILSKDSDFLHLVERLGSPPQLFWVTMGNTSNQKRREALSKNIFAIKQLLEKGEAVVEMTDL